MIDPRMIPESSLMDIDEKLYYATIKFFENPENQKAYEKWAAERRMKLEQAG